MHFISPNSSAMIFNNENVLHSKMCCAFQPFHKKCLTKRNVSLFARFFHIFFSSHPGVQFCYWIERKMSVRLWNNNILIDFQQCSGKKLIFLKWIFPLMLEYTIFTRAKLETIFFLFKCKRKVVGCFARTYIHRLAYL